MKNREEFYNEYLQSDAWKEIRRQVWAESQGRCYCCGLPGSDVHHRTYQNFGHEKMGDCVLVCKPCHKYIHTKTGKYTVKRATELVRQEKQGITPKAKVWNEGLVVTRAGPVTVTHADGTVTTQQAMPPGKQFIPRRKRKRPRQPYRPKSKG